MRDVTQEVGEVEDITRQDPTAMLLKTRNRSGEEGVGLTKIQKEMVAYEALEELPSNKARLSWWKDKEQMLPLLAGVAKGILGLPCSSAKSERVYSVGGRNVTKSRVRLKPSKVEHLIVNVENRKKVEDFLQFSSYKLLEEVENAFDKIILEPDVNGGSTELDEVGDEGSNVFRDQDMDVRELMTLEYSDSELEDDDED